MLVDCHCHIFKEYYEDIDAINKKIINSGIDYVINNACNYETALEVLELSKKYDNMFCTIGLHPEEDLNEIDKIIDLIEKEKDNKKMIGIGEIGLDYHYTKDNKDKQLEILKKQLDVAAKYNIPVIIHSREATKDMIDILKKYSLKGIIHCFNGSVEIAREYVNLGYKLGINGVITFNNCKLISVLKQIGVNNVVFETDSPYLTPVPDRGKRNDSSYINNIIDFVSKNLGVDKKTLEEISSKNVNELFDI